jgi:hypothetical protein
MPKCPDFNIYYSEGQILTDHLAELKKELVFLNLYDKARRYLMNLAKGLLYHISGQAIAF